MHRCLPPHHQRPWNSFRVISWEPPIDITTFVTVRVQIQASYTPQDSGLPFELTASLKQIEFRHALGALKFALMICIQQGVCACVRVYVLMSA